MPCTWNIVSKTSSFALYVSAGLEVRLLAPERRHEVDGVVGELVGAVDTHLRNLADGFLQVVAHLLLFRPLLLDLRLRVLHRRLLRRQISKPLVAIVPQIPGSRAGVPAASAKAEPEFHQDVERLPRHPVACAISDICGSRSVRRPAAHRESLAVHSGPFCAFGDLFLVWALVPPIRTACATLGNHLAVASLGSFASARDQALPARAHSLKCEPPPVQAVQFPIFFSKGSEARVYLDD